MPWSTALTLPWQKEPTTSLANTDQQRSPGSRITHKSCVTNGQNWNTRRIWPKVQNFTEKPTSKLKMHEKSKENIDWRTMPRYWRKPAEKQQQEHLPACERTDKLKRRENYYHPGQSREMSHRRTRHSKEVDRVVLWIVYTDNNRRSQGAGCPSTFLSSPFYGLGWWWFFSILQELYHSSMIHWRVQGVFS